MLSADHPRAPRNESTWTGPFGPAARSHARPTTRQTAAAAVSARHRRRTSITGATARGQSFNIAADPRAIPPPTSSSRRSTSAIPHVASATDTRSKR